MAKKIIKMNLNPKSIDNAIRELRAYNTSLNAKKDELLKRLAYIGVKEASVRFTTAIYDGVNDVTVQLDKNVDGYCITAKGKAVAFIEFGAGVYHNPGEPYPDPRPEGIVGIGEYGEGHGKRQAWGYRDESGEVVITRGNPAAMPMWYASEEMRSAVAEIFKEVFG